MARALSFRHQEGGKTGGAKRSTRFACLADPDAAQRLAQGGRQGRHIGPHLQGRQRGVWAPVEAGGCAVSLMEGGQAQGSSMLCAPRVLPTISHANHPAPPAAGWSSPPAAAEYCWPPPPTPRAEGAPHSPKGLPLARPAHCPLLQLPPLLPPHSAPPLPPLPPLLLHLLRHLLHCRSGFAGGPPLGS